MFFVSYMNVCMYQELLEKKKKIPSVSAHLVNKAYSVSEKLTCKKMDLWILPEKKNHIFAISLTPPFEATSSNQSIHA